MHLVEVGLKWRDLRPGDVVEVGGNPSLLVEVDDVGRTWLDLVYGRLFYFKSDNALFEESEVGARDAVHLTRER